MDGVDYEKLPQLIEWARAPGHIDGALVVHGSLPLQIDCEASTNETLRAIEVNGTSAVAVLGVFANLLQAQGSGVLAVIGSVAGDRGRASNYTYGAAKALVATFAAGLRHRLAKDGVRVVTIKPGFVDTPMTAAIVKKGLLWATPAAVADCIVAAMDTKTGVVYAPWFWRYIMWVIRSIPEPLFIRTRL
jgi:short-subunit dehydrogenase